MKRSLKIMKILSVSSMIMLTMFLATCGGDGESPPAPGISYTGPTTQTMINENNAEDLATGAYAGVNTGTSISVMNTTRSGDGGRIGYPLILKLSQVLGDSLQQVDLILRSGGISFLTVQTETGTDYGNCGGSLSYSISIDDVTGDFNGTFTFNNYCEDAVTISGNMSVSGKIDLYTAEFLSYTVSFESLTFTSDSDSFTTAGTITYYKFSISSFTASMDIKRHDKDTGKVFWMMTYNITLTKVINYFKLEASIYIYY